MKLFHLSFYLIPLSFIGKRILRVLVFIVMFTMLFSCNTVDSNTIAAEKEKSSDNLEQICQLTIDLNELNKYYHIEEIPNRKPLVILLNNFVQNKPRLTKFGIPVKFVSRTSLEKELIPYLEFTKIEIQTNNAEVNFIYPVEGILGTINFRKKGDSWQVENYRLVER